MDINITFVIQGINFGICYLILKYCFLQPATKLLLSREAEYSNLVQDLQRGESILQNKMAYKDALTSKFRARMEEKYPRKELMPSSGQSVQPVTYRYSTSDVVNCREALKKLLVAKAT